MSMPVHNPLNALKFKRMRAQSSAYNDLDKNEFLKNLVARQTEIFQKNEEASADLPETSNLPPETQSDVPPIVSPPNAPAMSPPKSTPPSNDSTPKTSTRPKRTVHQPFTRKRKSILEEMELPSKKAPVSQKFYNEIVQKEPVLGDYSLSSAIVMHPYLLKRPADQKSMISKLTTKFKADLRLAKQKKLRYWFIFERPFHACNKPTFAAGHAFISQLPIDFRIRYLADVLKGIKLANSGVTHVVLNLTSNWITEFDTTAINADEEFKTLFSSLDLLFKTANIKKVVVLTVPLERQLFHSASYVHNTVSQQIININKGQDKKLFAFEMYDTFMKKEKKHDEASFRRALEHISNVHFKD